VALDCYAFADRIGREGSTRSALKRGSWCTDPDGTINCLETHEPAPGRLDRPSRQAPDGA
jgi:hypothetical protein